METLGESINYLKTNIHNKEKVTEVETLIDDCIVALTSIEDALNKNYKDISSNLLIYTRDIRDGFINLKEILEEDDQSKEKILKNIEQNYIEAKKVKDFDFTKILFRFGLSFNKVYTIIKMIYERQGSLSKK